MKKEEILGTDFEGCILKKKSLREILLSLGKLENGNIIIPDKNLDIYPIVLQDDGMGNGINDQFIVETYFNKHCQIFTSKQACYKAWCMSKTDFLKFFFECDEVPYGKSIISISNSFKKEHKFADAENVLNLDFDDITEEKEGLKLFDCPEKVIDFVYDNLGNDFYIHCDAGISRSQAITKYIVDTYSGINWETNPNNPCKFYNPYVYTKLTHLQKEIELSEAFGNN